MTIGIDASRANNIKKTGVEWYAWHMIQQLKKITPDSVRVVLYSREPLRGVLGELPPNWESRVLKWPPKRLWTQIRFSLEMLFRKPDVLFIPSHVPPFIRPKKTIMMVHDIAAYRFPEAYSRFERWYSLWAAELALTRLHRVLVPSEFTKEELLKLDIGSDELPAHIRVIHHGYDKRYCQIHDDVRMEKVFLRYGISTPYIMTIGRLEEKKNTANLVHAFAELKKRYASRIPANLKLLLVGKPGYGYEKVEQAIAASGFRHEIIEPGWVRDEDLAYLINGAEAFVFPSLHEGFGIPVVEAMACGTPVVSSRAASLPEVAGDAVLYADPSDHKQLAHRIEQLLCNAHTREVKIERGLARAQTFSWEACAVQTLAVLLEE